jgi:hypothetical protein
VVCGTLFNRYRDGIVGPPILAADAFSRRLQDKVDQRRHKAGLPPQLAAPQNIRSV